MRITNNYNLPESVYNFISEDRYDPGSSDYSVTTLLNPPRLVQLQRRHWDELEEDCMDRIWSVFGTAVHNLFEDHTKGGVAEERLYVTIDGVRVGGQMDHVQDGVITDYKVTSTYKVMGDTPREWIEQQNIYAYLQERNGRPIHRLQICAILRDWSRTKAKQDRSYPQTPVQMIELPLWDMYDTAHFLRERVRVHKDAAKRSDSELPLCEGAEMWEQPTKYAVMKTGGKRAIRLFDSELAASDYIIDTYGYQDTNYGIETRLGKRTRCEDFCPVKAFCSQYKEYADAK